MLHYDLITSIDRFSDTGSCTMNYFDLSSSVSLTFKGGAVSSIITAVHVLIFLTTSQHTLCDTPKQMIVALSWIMFGDPFHIRYLDNFFKLFDNVGKVLHDDIYDGIPCLFVFFDLALVLRDKAITNPFPDLSNFPFDSKDVVSILFRLSNFFEIFKVTHLSLPLISCVS